MKENIIGWLSIVLIVASPFILVFSITAGIDYCVQNQEIPPLSYEILNDQMKDDDSFQAEVKKCWEDRVITVEEFNRLQKSKKIRNFRNRIEM